MSESDWLSLMQKMHDQFASNHSEMNRTIKLLRRNHRWSEMIRDIKQYIRNCHTCKRAKVAKDKYHELLNSLSIFDRSWTDITLDFVTELFDNREYNAILMIINRLSKCITTFHASSTKTTQRSKKRQSCLFNMYENCTNFSQRWFRTEILSLFFSYETRYVEC
jgi:hypothetical protein